MKLNLHGKKNKKETICTGKDINIYCQIKFETGTKHIIMSKYEDNFFINNKNIVTFK
jgi:hypothetical protein